MACGGRASWLVTSPYTGDTGSGRPLIYCDGCRHEKRDVLWVAIPLPLLRADPDRVMSALYEADLTESDPDAAADVLELHGAWIEHAQSLVSARHRESPEP